MSLLPLNVCYYGKEDPLPEQRQLRAGLLSVILEAGDLLYVRWPYVAAPQCVPSRAALMTGHSPVAVQMTRFSTPLAEEDKTWLELLRAQGWFTVVAGRTFHLDGSGNQPPETKTVFDKYLRTFESCLLTTARTNNEGLHELDQSIQTGVHCAGGICALDSGCSSTGECPA